MSLDDLLSRFDTLEHVDSRDLYASVLRNLGNLSAIEVEALTRRDYEAKDLTDLLAYLWEGFDQLSEIDQSRRRIVFGVLQRESMDAGLAAYAAHFGMDAGISEAEMINIFSSFIKCHVAQTQ